LQKNANQDRERFNFADRINVTQVDWLKAEDCEEKAHFEAIFDARIRHFRQSTAIVLFWPLQLSVYTASP